MRLERSWMLRILSEERMSLTASSSNWGGYGALVGGTRNNSFQRIFIPTAFRCPPNRTKPKLAYVDQGYTAEWPATEAQTHGMRLEVVKHEEAKRGFVRLPRRWVVERDFA